MPASVASARVLVRAVHPYGIAVAVIETSKDRHGDVTAVAELGEITGCAFAIESSSEDNEQRDRVYTFAALYAPPHDIDIRVAYRVRLPAQSPYLPVALLGTTWEVIGLPQPWSSPFTGWTPGSVIRIQRVTG